MTDVKKTEELNEAELDQVTGGIGLLLPAVQAVREPSARKAVPAENISIAYEEIKQTYKSNS